MIKTYNYIITGHKMLKKSILKKKLFLLTKISVLLIFCGCEQAKINRLLENDPIRAHKLLSAKIKNKPEDSNLYALRGIANKNSGNIVAAIEDFNHALSIDPSNFYALANRGIANLSLKRYAQAITDISAALLLTKKSQELAELHLLLGSIYHYDLKKYKAADAEYFIAAATAPENINIKINQAILLFNTGKAKLAIEKFEDILKEHPNNLKVCNDYAWVLARCDKTNLCDNKKALYLAQRAISLQKNPITYDTLALAYAVNSEFHKAVVAQKSAIKMVEESPRMSQKYQQLLLQFEHRLHCYENNLVPQIPIETNRELEIWLR